jgi:IS30 family transposase
MPHLTCEQRYQIYELKDTHTQAQIAHIIGVHPSTIGREFKRNTSQRGYRPQYAHAQYCKRRQQNTNAHTISDSTWITVEYLLRLKYSPQQVSYRLQAEQGVSISHETIYQYIYANKEKNGDLHTYLRCQKQRRKRYASGQQRRGAIPNRIDISQRPPEVEAKQRIGDLEGDTVIGKNHQGAIVTLVDRASLYLFAELMQSKHAHLTTSAIINQLKPYQDRCHTITFDNGKEFAGHEHITKELGASIYFATPYHSWERGANENTNGLLRQFFPKKTDFSKITQEQLQQAVDNINHRPRKTLGYKSAYEVFFKVSLRYTDIPVAFRN